MQDFDISINIAFSTDLHRFGGEYSVFDLLAGKGYSTRLFAPHFYNIALEMI